MLGNGHHLSKREEIDIVTRRRWVQFIEKPWTLFPWLPVICGTTRLSIVLVSVSVASLTLRSLFYYFSKWYYACIDFYKHFFFFFLLIEPALISICLSICLNPDTLSCTCTVASGFTVCVCFNQIVSTQSRGHFRPVVAVRSRMSFVKNINNSTISVKNFNSTSLNTIYREFQIISLGKKLI